MQQSNYLFITGVEEVEEQGGQMTELLKQKGLPDLSDICAKSQQLLPTNLLKVINLIFIVFSQR